MATAADSKARLPRPSAIPYHTYVQHENVQTLVDRIIKRIKVHRTCEGFTDEQMYQVLDEAQRVLTPLPAMVEIEPPLVIFGDTHGQLNDLLRFADIVGEPPGTQWLLLGDYVDRCKKGLEVIMLLLCFKIKYPSRVHMMRGNHECQKTNRIYGFYNELKTKRSVTMWVRFNKLFNELPLCAAVSRRMLCMHGGISQHIKDWSSLTELKKPHSITECDDGIALDLLWADPTNDACDFKYNANRCTSVVFGDKAVKDFCKLLGISMIVRAHEAVQDGHHLMHGGRVCTLFSAPNYCGNDGNSASVMHVSPTFKLTFTTLKPRVETSSVSPDLLKKLKNETEARSPNPQPVRRYSVSEPHPSSSSSSSSAAAAAAVAAVPSEAGQSYYNPPAASSSSGSSWASSTSPTDGKK